MVPVKYNGGGGGGGQGLGILQQIMGYAKGGGSSQPDDGEDNLTDSQWNDLTNQGAKPDQGSGAQPVQSSLQLQNPDSNFQSFFDSANRRMQQYQQQKPVTVGSGGMGSGNASGLMGSISSLA